MNWEECEKLLTEADKQRIIREKQAEIDAEKDAFVIDQYDNAYCEW